MIRKYFAIIPARSGSKGIKDKNIIPFNGLPLLCHSLKAAAESSLLSGYCLWTDSPEYKRLAAQHCKLGVDFGLRTQFIDDHALDWQHMLDLSARLEMRKIECDALVLVRPTSPNRPSDLIDKCIMEFDKSWDHYDSLRTVSPAPETPFKMWFEYEDKNGRRVGDPISTYLTDKQDAHSMPRQLLREVWWQNAAIDIVKLSVIKNKSSAGNRVLLFKMGDNVLDIDTLKDLEKD